MTRVDFYLLPDVDAAAKLRFACRLAAQAVGQGKRVHVRASDDDAAREIDALMWSYPEERFLPHELLGSEAETFAPVRISHEEPAPDSDEVLINVGADIPGFFARYERVAEVFTEADKAEGRQRYRTYRDRGYPLFHHQLDDWES